MFLDMHACLQTYFFSLICTKHVNLQLNIERSLQRRPPVHVHSMQMPFDADKFNFNKISPREIICYLRPEEQKPVGT